MKLDIEKINTIQKFIQHTAINDNHNKLLDVLYTTAIIMFLLFLFLIIMLFASNRQFSIGLKSFFVFSSLVAFVGFVLTVLSMHDSINDDKIQYSIDKISDYWNIIFAALIFFVILLFLIFALYKNNLFNNSMGSTKIVKFLNVILDDCIYKKQITTTGTTTLNNHIATMTVLLIMNAVTFATLRIYAIK